MGVVALDDHALFQKQLMFTIIHINHVPNRDRWNILRNSLARAINSKRNQSLRLLVKPEYPITAATVKEPGMFGLVRTP